MPKNPVRPMRAIPRFITGFFLAGAWRATDAGQQLQLGPQGSAGCNAVEPRGCDLHPGYRQKL